MKDDRMARPGLRFILCAPGSLEQASAAAISDAAYTRCKSNSYRMHMCSYTQHAYHILSSLQIAPCVPDTGLAFALSSCSNTSSWQSLPRARSLV